MVLLILYVKAGTAQKWLMDQGSPLNQNQFFLCLVLFTEEENLFIKALVYDLGFFMCKESSEIYNYLMNQFKMKMTKLSLVVRKL